MTTIRRTTLVLSAAALLLGLVLGLVACSGLDSSNADLPTPAIAQGSAPAACGSPASGATLTLSDIGTRVTLDAPATPPTNRIDVVGSSSGLDPAAIIILFMLPTNTDCPSYSQVTVALQADGSFAGTLNLSTLSQVRVVAFAAPAGAVVSCTDLDSCVSVAGYLAMSNALEIRLQ